MPTHAYFEDIQSQIIKELQKAKQQILLAVAWFTDATLLEILCQKAQKGIKVCLLLQDDQINRGNYAPNFDNLQKSGGEILWVKPLGNDKMHNKFCVIDSDVVITGSYNWTNQAHRNKENITIQSADPYLAKQFITYFGQLRKEYFSTADSIIDYQAVRLRLDILKNVISLQDSDDIASQTQRLGKLLIGNIPENLAEIMAVLENQNYTEAERLIQMYLQNIEKILATPPPTNWKAWFESLDAQWQKLIALHVDLMDRGMEYKEFTKYAWINPYAKYQEKIGHEFAYAPFDFTKIENLTYLYLHNSKLSHLPIEIGQLENLTSLDLSDNPNLDLADTFNKIGQLRNLTHLFLYKNQLSNLPVEIGQLKNLTFLNLKCNVLSHLPAEIGQLENLTKLDLSENQLSHLPTEIGKLRNVTELNLRKNQLSHLPAEIGKLRNLTNLDLGENQLSHLPAEIWQLQNLTLLSLSWNQLSHLPAEIGKLTNLKALFLSNNQLSHLPAEIGQLRNLTYLNLSDNQLSHLPAEIEKLRNLTRLELGGNPNLDLADTFNKIGKLTNLTDLFLLLSKLSHLPTEIGLLRNLTLLSLYLGGNQFSEQEQTRIRKLLPNCKYIFF